MRYSELYQRKTDTETVVTLAIQHEVKTKNGKETITRLTCPKKKVFLGRLPFSTKLMYL